MTKEEQHQEVGRLIEDYKKAKEVHICLRAKASRFARDLKQIASYLETENLTAHYRGGKWMFLGNHSDQFLTLHSDKAVATLTRELDDAEKHLSDLEEKLEGLGISNPQ